jgi:hypothetical protein
MEKKDMAVELETREEAGSPKQSGGVAAGRIGKEGEVTGFGVERCLLAKYDVMSGRSGTREWVGRKTRHGRHSPAFAFIFPGSVRYDGSTSATGEKDLNHELPS